MTSETDAEYVSRFVSVHGRLPEYCTRCEQWEGVCWHHPSPPAPHLPAPIGADVTPERPANNERSACTITCPSSAVLICKVDHGAHADHFYVHPGIPQENR